MKNLNSQERQRFLKIVEEQKDKMKDFDKHTAWIDKILKTPEKHFEIVVKFAQEAQKRLGRTKDE
jgi:hypothetical protein